MDGVTATVSKPFAIVVTHPSRQRVEPRRRRCYAPTATSAWLRRAC